MQWGHFYLNQGPYALAHPTTLAPFPEEDWRRGRGPLHDRRLNAPIYRNEKVAGFEGYLTDVLNDEAVRFVERNKDRPFFLYLAHDRAARSRRSHREVPEPLPFAQRRETAQDVRGGPQRRGRRRGPDPGQAAGARPGEEHGDLLHQRQRRAEFLEAATGNSDVVKAGTPLGAPKPGEKPDFRVVSRRFQWSIGANGSDNEPLSFGKGILYEGGVRVPYVVRWPGVVPAGKTIDAVVSHLDIVPTCVAAAGGTLPADREYDGADLRPYFEGKAGDWHDRPMFWRVWKDRAVRMGKWKLDWSGEARPRLYDLAKDVEEEKDLAAENPDVVKRLQAEWAAWNRKNIAPLFQYEAKAGPWNRGD